MVDRVQIKIDARGDKILTLISGNVDNAIQVLLDVIIQVAKKQGLSLDKEKTASTTNADDFKGL